MRGEITTEWVFHHDKVMAQPSCQCCDLNSRDSSSSWFPLVAFSIFLPGAHRHYRFLQIVFRSVCKKSTVCEEMTEKKMSLQTPRVQLWLLPKTAPEVFLIPLAVCKTRAWRLCSADAAAVQTPVHFWLMKAKHLCAKKYLSIIISASHQCA